MNATNPAAAAVTVTAEQGASERQAELVNRLLAERMIGAETLAWIARRVEGGTFDKRAASRTIEHLFTLPKLATTAASAVTVDKLEEGVYELDGRIYRVKVGHHGGRLYAVKVVEDATDDDALVARYDAIAAAGDEVPAELLVAKVRFDYAPGMMRELRPEHRVSVERAEALSSALTFCIRCGRHLEATESVQAGIGPVCRTKV